MGHVVYGPAPLVAVAGGEGRDTLCWKKQFHALIHQPSASSAHITFVRALAAAVHKYVLCRSPSAVFKTRPLDYLWHQRIYLASGSRFDRVNTQHRCVRSKWPTSFVHFAWCFVCRDPKSEH